MKSAIITAGMYSLATAYASTENIVVPPDNLTTIQYNTILAGIAWGFIEKESLTEIETCIKDGKDEALLAFDAYLHISSGTPADIAAGIAELAVVTQQLPGLLADCKNTQDDIASLEAIAANLEA